MNWTKKQPLPNVPSCNLRVQTSHGLILYQKIVRGIIKEKNMILSLDRLQIRRYCATGGIDMNDEKFAAIMGVLVEQVVHLIAENYEYDELVASNAFYNSKVYALLEQEETKLWHFSPLTLFNLFVEEQKTGSFELPEED